MKKISLTLLFVLSILSCEVNRPGQDRTLNLSNKDFSPLEVSHHLSGPLSGRDIPVSLLMDQDETVSTLTVGSGSKLVIMNSLGQREIISGENISAEYYHINRLLEVSAEINGLTQIYYYIEPVSWHTED